MARTHGLTKRLPRDASRNRSKPASIVISFAFLSHRNSPGVGLRYCTEPYWSVPKLARVSMRILDISAAGSQDPNLIM